jgi:ABC-type phosphate/phosphonate transport system permease subunit
MLSFVVALFLGVFVAFFLEYLAKQNIIIENYLPLYRKSKKAQR